MQTFSNKSIVGVFHDHQSAQRAVTELKLSGFTDDQIGVVGRDTGDLSRTADDDESFAAEGAGAGVAAGAGIGALWGLGIIAGALSPIGPAIAGGALATILTSAAAGAATAGLAGMLVGMGISKDEADYYESEFHAGRIIVTVSTADREAEARSILLNHGAYDFENRSTSTTNVSSAAPHSGRATTFPHTEVDVPLTRDDVVGERTRVSKLHDLD